MPALLCCTNVAQWAYLGPCAVQKLQPSWLAAGLLLNAGSALTKGGQVMFCPQPLHHLPSLGICAHCCTQAALLCGQKPCPSWLAAGLLLNAGSALAKGGQVMSCPQPLHELPSLGISAHRYARANPALLHQLLLYYNDPKDSGFQKPI